MSRFTPQEIEYLQNSRLGRMATVDQKGDLHVVPVGFRCHRARGARGPSRETRALAGREAPWLGTRCAPSRSPSP